VRSLERSETCPVCRECMLAEDLVPHQSIRSLLDEVTVVCDRECGWTGRRDALNAHKAVCPIVLMEQAHERLEAHSRRFADVDRQLTEKDARIAELEALVAEKDRLVVSTGQEVVKRELKIAELHASYQKLERQFYNCRRQLSERSSDLERLHESNEGTVSSQTGRPPSMSVPTSARLDAISQHEGLEATLEATNDVARCHEVEALRNLSLNAALARRDGHIAEKDGGLDHTSAEMREDAWLDPAGFSRMDLHEESSSSLAHLCNPDESAEEPWL